MFVVPLNVSVAFIKNGCAPPAYTDVSVFSDDVVLALAVITPVDECIVNLWTIMAQLW